MMKAIWAEDLDGALGDGRDMLWHIPEDFKRFKELTLYSIIVMGRNTWESLPSKSRPLPGRTNIVISKSLKLEQMPDGVAVFPDLSQIRHLAKEKLVWIIGGGTIYSQTIKQVSLVERTVIHLHSGGNVLAPKLDEHGFKLLHKTNVIRSENKDIKFHYETWERK